MKKLFVLFYILIGLSLINSSNAQILVDNFDYSVGQLTSGGGGANVSDSSWISFSGTGVFIPVISGSLSYPGYSASGIGNKVQLVAATTSAEDARTDIPAQSGDGTKVYASFLVNVQSAPASGGSSYFAALYSVAAGFKGRIYTQTLGAGIEFGLEGSGSAPVFTGVELPLNQTHLIVICYEFLAGADSVKLWVNPAISGVQPAPSLVYQVAADFAVCDAFALRQASTGGVAQNPDAEIDGLIISNLWQEVVPVELTSFTASVTGTSINLNWSTASEINNSGFEVERKTANSSWQKLGFVNGNGTTTEKQTYSYTDRNLTEGSYNYRLKQVDFNGEFEYSNVIEVLVVAPNKFELSQNYPNPFNPSTSISFTLPQAGNVKLSVYNLLGQEVQTLVNGFMETGLHSVNFEAKNLNSGIYLYKLEANGINSVRKMTLLK
jgi:hypothetical protein